MFMVWQWGTDVTFFFFLSDPNNDKQLKSAGKKGKRKKDMNFVGSLEGKDILPWFSFEKVWYKYSLKNFGIRRVLVQYVIYTFGSGFSFE